MHGNDFEQFGFVERRKNSREAAREHRLPCSRRADKQNVMSSSRGDLKSAFGGGLTYDVGKVESVFVSILSRRRFGHWRQNVSAQ